MTPLAPEPRHSVEALSFLALALALASPSHKGAFYLSRKGKMLSDRTSYWCGVDGDYESSLEIHVPQAFAADGYAHVLCG